MALKEPTYLERGENGWQLKKEFADQLSVISKKRKELDMEEEPIKKGVKLEAKQLIPCGGDLGEYQYQVTASYISKDFDIELLKNEYPDVYEKCCKLTYHKGQEKLMPVTRTKKEK